MTAHWSGDPTKPELLNFLETTFAPTEDMAVEVEEAIYWFANDYHGGQWSSLYSVLCTSPFNPSPLANGPDQEGEARLMYEALEKEFAS